MIKAEIFTLLGTGHIRLVSTEFLRLEFPHFIIYNLWKSMKTN